MPDKPWVARRQFPELDLRDVNNHRCEWQTEAGSASILKIREA